MVASANTVSTNGDSLVKNHAANKKIPQML